MNENQLIKFWNDQRSASIKLQIPPTILFASILALGTTGRLTHKSALSLRIITLTVVLAALIFAVSGVLATIRDGVSTVRSLEELKGLTPLGKKIRKSSPSLIVIGYSVSAFALLNLILLALYLFKS
jgi:hypothetical protein